MEKLAENTTSEVKELKSEIAYLKEQLEWFKRQLFGQKSERFVDEFSNQPELGLEVTQEEVEEEIEEVPAHKRKKSRKGISLNRFEIPDDLPRQEIFIDVDEKDKFCPETGEALVEFRKEECEKLAYKPGSYFVKKYIRPVYKSKSSCSPTITCASLPEMPIEKCRVDVTLLAFILVQKFADHLPLYRIEEIMKRSGINIQRQTLCGWVLKLGELLEPLYDEMFNQVLNGDRLFTDATGMNYLMKGKGSQKGNMWVYCGGEAENPAKDPPYLLYEFSENGDHHHTLSRLDKFSGLMHSDAHGAYDKTAQREDIQWQLCLAHARRKFENANGAAPQLRDKVLKLFRELFKNEREAWQMNADQRLKFRQVKQAPIINEVLSICKENLLSGDFTPSMKITKAFQYMYKRKEHCRTFLENPMAVIDNNFSERTVKPLVIGRKNWLFLGNKNSGKSTATILSLVQTCRHLKVNPYDYLVDVLPRIMNHNSQKIGELLPDKWAKSQKQR